MARNRVLAGLHRASGRRADRRGDGDTRRATKVGGAFSRPPSTPTSPHIERGQASKKPQQVVTEVSTRRGFRSELYRNSSGRQTGLEMILRAIFTSLLAVGNLGVMSPGHRPDPRQLLPPC